MPDRCRICGKPIPPDAPETARFCSERCRLIDLAKWLGEEYRIPEKQEENEDPTAIPPADNAPDEEPDA